MYGMSSMRGSRLVVSRNQITMAAIRRHLTLIAACIGLATAISKPFHNSSMPDLRPTFVVNFDINKVICQHSENPEDLHLHNMSVLCDGVPDCFQNPALHDENFPFCEGECTSTCNNRGACLYDGERAQCYCNAGFHGPSCEYEDVNECQEDHPCSFLAQCINTLGAYKCECLSGFKGDGYNCTDINECEEQIAACPENSNCVNLPGSHFCNCSSGFAPRGTPMEKCADIDECELGIFTCPDDKFCQNTIGNYDCVTDCSVGFELNGTVCSEVNECLNANPGPCHQKATCENTVGGYTCTCDEGFTGDGHDCSPLSDCSKDSNVCDRHGYCIAAFKTCTCKTGYSGDGFTCRDIDECANENPCKGDNGSKCVNIDGGYVCCDKDTDDEKCIEEKGAYCSGGCGQHALCLNQTCTCLEGYQGNADVRCEDINECEDEEICLGVGQWCVNFLGGHICCDANSTALECGRTGLTTLFTIESSTIVSTNEEKSEDHESFIGILESGGRWIDESGGILLIAQGQTNGSEELSSGEVIQSTAFSFKLPECEINESRNATICPENSECSEGRCICIEGYEWDGLNGGCADINECESEPYPCNETDSDSSWCVNYAGGYQCCTTESKETECQGLEIVAVNSETNEGGLQMSGSSVEQSRSKVEIFDDESQSQSRRKIIVNGRINEVQLIDEKNLKSESQGNETLSSESTKVDTEKNSAPQSGTTFTGSAIEVELVLTTPLSKISKASTQVKNTTHGTSSSKKTTVELSTTTKVDSNNQNQKHTSGESNTTSDSATSARISSGAGMQNVNQKVTITTAGNDTTVIETIILTTKQVFKISDDGSTVVTKEVQGEENIRDILQALNVSISDSGNEVSSSFGNGTHQWTTIKKNGGQETITIIVEAGEGTQSSNQKPNTTVEIHTTRLQTNISSSEESTHEKDLIIGSSNIKTSETNDTTIRVTNGSEKPSNSVETKTKIILDESNAGQNSENTNSRQNTNNTVGNGENSKSAEESESFHLVSSVNVIEGNDTMSETKLRKTWTETKEVGASEIKENSKTRKFETIKSPEEKEVVDLFHVIAAVNVTDASDEVNETLSIQRKSSTNSNNEKNPEALKETGTVKEYHVVASVQVNEPNKTWTEIGAVGSLKNANLTISANKSAKQSVETGQSFAATTVTESGLLERNQTSQLSSSKSSGELNSRAVDNSTADAEAFHILTSVQVIEENETLAESKLTHSSETSTATSVTGPLSTTLKSTTSKAATKKSLQKIDIAATTDEQHVTTLKPTKHAKIVVDVTAESSEGSKNDSKNYQDKELWISSETKRNNTALYELSAETKNQRTTLAVPQQTTVAVLKADQKAVGDVDQRTKGGTNFSENEHHTSKINNSGNTGQTIKHGHKITTTTVTKNVTISTDIKKPNITTLNQQNKFSGAEALNVSLRNDHKANTGSGISSNSIGEATEKTTSFVNADLSNHETTILLPANTSVVSKSDNANGMSKASLQIPPKDNESTSASVESSSNTTDSEIISQKVKTKILVEVDKSSTEQVSTARKNENHVLTDSASVAEKGDQHATVGLTTTTQLATTIDNNRATEGTETDLSRIAEQSSTIVSETSTEPTTTAATRVSNADKITKIHATKSKASGEIDEKSAEINHNTNSAEKSSQQTVTQNWNKGFRNMLKTITNVMETSEQETNSPTNNVSNSMAVSSIKNLEPDDVVISARIVHVQKTDANNSEITVPVRGKITPIVDTLTGEHSNSSKSISVVSNSLSPESHSATGWITAHKTGHDIVFNASGNDNDKVQITATISTIAVAHDNQGSRSSSGKVVELNLFNPAEHTTGSGKTSNITRVLVLEEPSDSRETESSRSENSGESKTSGNQETNGGSHFTVTEPALLNKHENNFISTGSTNNNISEKNQGIGKIVEIDIINGDNSNHTVEFSSRKNLTKLIVKEESSEWSSSGSSQKSSSKKTQISTEHDHNAATSNKATDAGGSSWENTAKTIEVLTGNSKNKSETLLASGLSQQTKNSNKNSEVVSKETTHSPDSGDLMLQTTSSASPKQEILNVTDSTAIIATASAEIVGSNEKGLEISADMINAEETTALPTTTVEGERGTTEADAGSTGSEDQNVVSGEAGLEISGFNLGGEGASSTPSSTPELTETTTGSASSSSTNPDAGTTTASAEEPAQSSLATTTEPSKIETDDGEESSNENINELLEKGNGSTLATKSAGSSTAEPSTSTSASPDVSTQGVTSEEVEPSQATTIPSLEGSSTAASTVETLNTTAVSAITPAESTVTSEVTETSAQLPVESSTPAITTPESTVTSSTPSAESSTLAVTTVESTIASEVNATDSTSPVGSSAPESSTSGLEISATTSIPTTIVLSTQTTASSVETTASKPTNAPSEAITPTTSAPTDASSTVAASLAPEPAESTTAAPTTAEKTTSAQPASSTESSATETSTPAATGSTAESGLTPNGTETETIFVEVGATTETPITETSTVQSETGESASSGSTGTPEVVSTASVSTTPKQFTGLQIIKETGNNTTSPSRATEATAESTSVTSANMAPSETSASSASTEGASTASGATTTVSATSSETTVAGPISSTISPAALTESAIVASSATSEPEQSTTPEGSVPKSGEMGLELGPDGAKSEIATSTPGVELPDEGDNTSGEEVNKTQKLSTTTVSVHSIPTSGEQGLEIGPDEALESTTASSAPAEVTTSENASEIPTESTTVGSTTSSATTTSEPEVNVTAGLEIGPDVAATEQTPNPESTTAEQVTTGGPAEGLEISGIDLKTSTTSEPISSTTESEVVEGLEINGGMGRATTAAAETTSETTAIPTTEESSQKTTPVSTTETTAEATTETTTIVTEASTTELAAPETTASTQQQTESPTSTLTPPPTTATATGSTATTSGEVQPPSASPHPSIFIDEIENATESGITATTHCTTNDECGLNAYCERSSSTCRCSSGFRSQLLGGDCIDIDECKEKLDDCHSSSRCFNYIGGFQCLCAIGYRKNSAGICEDIDECLETNNTHCDANASCRNLPGAYLCECNKDFTGDGYTCIPEGQRHCKQTEWVKSDCGRNHLCLVDGNSTVNCDTCKRGFSMVHGVCSDINECENGVSNCHEDALCVNSMGSYSCQCQLGYAGDGYACKNIDECLQNPCHVQATCVDTLGSFVCKCPDGWTGDGVNACLNPGDLACSQRDSICGTKLDNSACLSLSFKDHFQSICECRAGFRLNVTSGICEDVDECEENRHNCDKQMSQCVNTPGGYQCQCMSGYEGSGGICVDVDECDRGIARCDVNANCINGIGGSECRCKAGFSGDGSTCVPIDERHAGISNCPDEWVDICKQSNKTCHVDDEELPQCGSCMFGFQPMDGKCQPINVAGNCVDPLKNDCDVNAECIDVRPGRHFCSCKTGYIGDGMHCDDVDECSIPRLCDTHAFCVNTNGSYECQCNDGFTGNGFKCVPANQSQNCRINPQICHTNAACQADGTCICIRGFSGDGVTSCEVLAVTEGSLYEMAFTGSSTASSILATSTSTALSSAAHNHSCSDNDRTACHVLANCDLAASECVCRQGFAGDGYLACVRIWEDCTTDPTMCHASASCDKSSKQCKCNVGYLGDGINCLPDETDCIVRSGLCSEFAQCTGRRCVCNEGYTGDGATCVPLEAPQHLAGNCSACHVHATCQVNTCQCVQGCLGNGYLCVPDPQDCVVYPGVCHMNGICNSQTRRCECKKGFLGNGLDCATRIPCSKNASICDTQAVCLPDGRCQCNRGYLGDGVECQRALSASELLSTTKPQLVLFECPESCGAHSDCINGACRCSRGYVSNDKGLCVDIDECHMNSTGCHANAQCTNTEGSYECTCRDGYSGDGRICSAVLDAPGSQSIDLVSGSIESGHSVQCKADGMLLELFEEHAPFLGRVFVRGQNSNPHCTKTFTANDTQLSFFIPIAHCDMTLEENDTLTTVVIIQKHAVFLTQDSYAYRLRCKYAQTTINVQAHADILDMVTEDTLSQNGTLSACQLRILNQENVVVDNAIVGQSLRLALSSVVSDSSPILPRSCYAINLETSQRYEITDKRGCAIDVDLFPEWDRLNATHLQATFLTFKWPDSVMIRFECDCAVCDAECPAVDCSRRREARHRQLRVARGYRFTTPPNDGEDDDSSWLKDVQMGTPSNTAFSSVVLVSDDEEEQLAQKQMEEWLENGHVNEDIFTNMDEERVCFPTQWIVICLLSIAFSLSCICAASSIYRRKTRLLPTTISE